MTLTEFLLARIAEDEAAPLEWQRVGGEAGSLAARRLLTECEAKRRIIELHESWPVLVETPPKFEAASWDPSSGSLDKVQMRVTQQIEWLTQQEYRARFGTEPPTTPVLRALALPYADHPDYEEEWRC